jgi:hypothetical protein
VFIIISYHHLGFYIVCLIALTMYCSLKALKFSEMRAVLILSQEITKHGDQNSGLIFHLPFVCMKDCLEAEREPK